MRFKCTTTGYLGLLVGLAGAAFLLVAAAARPPDPPDESPGRSPARSPAGAPTPAPTEEIDVEHAVDFPYDI